MHESLLVGIWIGFYPIKIKAIFAYNIHIPNPNELFHFENIIEELPRNGKPINKQLIKEL